MISRTGLSPSVIPPFQTDSAIAQLSNSLRSPTTPVRKSVWFGLLRFRSPLLTESIFLSVPLGTEMFQFSRLAACAYGFNARQFGNLRINSCLTDTRSLSQFSTPFKAFRRQDVPHALFFSYPASIEYSIRLTPFSVVHECEPKNVTFFEYSCRSISFELVESKDSTIDKIIVVCYYATLASPNCKIS